MSLMGLIHGILPRNSLGKIYQWSTSRSMIKAIIFDCYGVLVGDGLPVFVQRHFADNPEVMAQVWDNDDKVNRGEMSVRDELVYLSEQSGVAFNNIAREFDVNYPDEALFSYIKQELRPAYRLGICSNISRHEVLTELIGQEKRELFDAAILSCDLGVVKPDFRIYLACAEALGVEPEECLYVDDKERYCQPARELGMQTIVYRRFEQFQKDCARARSRQ